MVMRRGHLLPQANRVGFARITRLHTVGFPQSSCVYRTKWVAVRRIVLLMLRLDMLTAL
jgi:hypothetical protein